MNCSLYSLIHVHDVLHCLCHMTISKCAIHPIQVCGVSLVTSLAVVPPVVEEQGHEQEHVKEEMTVQEVILKLKIVILMLVQVRQQHVL